MANRAGVERSAPGIPPGLLDHTAPLVFKVAQQALKLVEAGQVEGIQVDAVVATHADEVATDEADDALFFG